MSPASPPRRHRIVGCSDRGKRGPWGVDHKRAEGADITALAIDPLASSHVFAATNQAGIFQSADSGLTWSFLALAGRSISAIVFDPHDPSKILTTAVFALFRSLDGGRTWASDSQGLPAAPPGGYPPKLSPPAFAPSQPSVAYIGWSSFVPGPYGVFYAYGGVLRTLDGGATWTALGPVGGAVSSVATDPGDPLRSKLEPIEQRPAPGCFGRDSGSGSSGRFERVRNGLRRSGRRRRLQERGRRSPLVGRQLGPRVRKRLRPRRRTD